jgi:hypothetical protein
VFAASGASAAPPGYDEYLDWRGWAARKHGRSAWLGSSYDRAGGNLDYCHYESPSGLVTDDRECIAFTVEGPGIVHRFWMPHLTAKRTFAVRMFFDGEDSPRIDTTSTTLLRGDYLDFDAPLVNTFAGGQVSLVPIAFAESLRVETTNKTIPPEEEYWSPNRHYYQYGISLLPDDAVVESFDGVRDEQEQAAFEAVASLFENAGTHPDRGDESSRIETGATEIPSGDSLTLADIAGPGLVREIRIVLDSPADETLDSLRLQVLYDRETQPAIDAALGDLFGAGHERAAHSGLPLGSDGNGAVYSFWPMPFHRRLRISLHNGGEATSAIESATIVYAAGRVEPNECYLRARANDSVKSDGDIYHTLLAVDGAGHYVGNLLYIEQDSFSFFMLEGDDVITVDGEHVLYGTGLEDAYNGGYYYNWVGGQSDEPEGIRPRSATRPLNGILHVFRQDGRSYARADQYRWLIADAIAFEASIDVKIENRYAVNGARWRSVAFWYQQPLVPGDLNCDFVIDFDDIDAFTLALVDPRGYSEVYPDCDADLADIDNDGDVDFDDIDPFVALLVR